MYHGRIWGTIPDPSALPGRESFSMQRKTKQHMCQWFNPKAATGAGVRHESRRQFRGGRPPKPWLYPQIVGTMVEGRLILQGMNRCELQISN